MEKLLLVIISIIFPPLGVGLKDGFNGTLLLNIVLTILGYIPGVLHALWVVIQDASNQN